MPDPKTLYTVVAVVVVGLVAWVGFVLATVKQQWAREVPAELADATAAPVETKADEDEKAEDKAAEKDEEKAEEKAEEKSEPKVEAKEEAKVEAKKEPEPVEDGKSEGAAEEVAKTT